MEVEDAGRRISLDELLVDLGRTEARMYGRKRTTDGHATACGTSACSIGVDSALVGAQAGEQDYASNDGALNRTHDTNSMSSTSYDNERYYDDDEYGNHHVNKDVENGNDAGGRMPVARNSDEGNGNGGKNPKDGSGTQNCKVNGKHGSDADERRRNPLVLVVSVLAVIGLAIGLGLFVKGITGLNADSKATASTGTAATAPDSNVNAAPRPSYLVPSSRPTWSALVKPTGNPTSNPPVPTETLDDEPDEMSIYEQFGVEMPDEGIKEEEESESSPTLSSDSVPTTSEPTGVPMAAPLSTDPTSSPSVAPTSVSPTGIPTRSPSRQPNILEAAPGPPTRVQPPPSSITTKFSMHITMDDANADFFDNRASFGKAVFGNTFDLFRKVISSANDSNGAYSLRAQSMRAGYSWDSGCNPFVGEGCPPDTVVVADFTGTSALEFISASTDGQDAFDGLVANAFVEEASSSDALTTWVSSVRDQGISVMSTVLYLNGKEVASYSMTDSFAIVDIENVSRESDVVIECEMQPIQVHLVASEGTNLLDYDLRQLLIDATLPYLSVALSNGLKEDYFGFRLKAPQNRGLRKAAQTSLEPQDPRRSLNHLIGEEYDVKLLGTATVAGGESACDRAKDIVRLSLSGDLLFLWIDEVNTVGLPVASADITF